MESTNLNIRTDKEVKIAAERIFEELGLNMTTVLDFIFMDGKCSIFFAVELGALVTVPVIMFIFRREKGKVTAGVPTEVTDLFPTYLLVGTVALLIAASFIPGRPAITNGLICMTLFLIGLGAAFGGYGDYYNGSQDDNAICYLTLANLLIHEVNPKAITIAEEVSGMPGLASSFKDGGYGFDYRMAMNIPDYWIKIIKEQRDEDWKPSSIFWELTNRRADEHTRGLRPFLRRLFPRSMDDAACAGALCGNLSANLLGLGNAATPLGVQAVQRMKRLAGGDTASDEMCRLIVMNTASLQLLPTTVASVRAGLGAARPFEILLPVWLASVCSVSAGLLADERPDSSGLSADLTGSRETTSEPISRRQYGARHHQSDTR